MIKTKRCRSVNMSARIIITIKRFKKLDKLGLELSGTTDF